MISVGVVHCILRRLYSAHYFKKWRHFVSSKTLLCFRD